MIANVVFHSLCILLTSIVIAVIKAIDILLHTRLFKSSLCINTLYEKDCIFFKVDRSLTIDFLCICDIREVVKPSTCPISVNVSSS